MPYPDHEWTDSAGRRHKAGSIAFAEGNRGGPGRKRLTDERRVLRIMSNACTDEDVREITEKHVRQAKNGSVKSAEFLWKYLVGTPRPISPDEGQENQFVAMFATFLQNVPMAQLAQMAQSQGMIDPQQLPADLVDESVEGEIVE